MTEHMDNAVYTDNAGGDVARDPDAIQREIEQTRAELAQTIDEIADRISPRRAAARGADKVTAVFSREETAGALVAGPGGNGQSPATAGTLGEIVTHGGAGYSGTTTFTTQRVLRKERVLIAVGGVAAVTALVVFLRTRHRS